MFHLAPNGFVGDRDAAFRQQIFDVPAIDTSLLSCHKPCYVASEVLAVVIIGVEDTHVAMTGKLLHRPHVTPREIECCCNGKMAKAVRADREPARRSELFDDGEDRRALLGVVEIGEERTVLGPARLEPRATPRGQPSSAPGWSRIPFASALSLELRCGSPAGWEDRRLHADRR
jgi:hypothetical protein